MAISRAAIAAVRWRASICYFGRTFCGHDHVSGACLQFALDSGDDDSCSINDCGGLCSSALLAWRSVASAQDASDWDAQPHTAARLIAGALSKPPLRRFLRAGVEIKLDPGWKTYWRDPGDSGVPPTFDFSGSDNVKSATVLWPAPERFSDGAGGNSIGYVDHVILPLQVAAARRGEAIVAASQARLCHLRKSLRAGRGQPEARAQRRRRRGRGDREGGNSRAAARAARPNAGPSDGLAILAVHREPGGAHDASSSMLPRPAGAPVDLFVEGPTPDWSLPQPEPTGGDGATRQFTFDLDGLPPDAQAIGATLTFTAVSARRRHRGSGPSRLIRAGR